MKDNLKNWLAQLITNVFAKDIGLSDAKKMS